MCGGSKPQAPAPAPVAVADPTIANRGSTTSGANVNDARRLAATEDTNKGGIGGLSGSTTPGAPVTKSVLGG